MKYASEDYRKTQTRIFDDNQLSVSMRASERETLGIIRNIHFLVKNFISLNKASPLHSLIDDQMEFYQQGNCELRVSGASDTDEYCVTGFRSPISISHRSGYSTWEFVHSLNAVVELDDIQSLRNARFYSLLVDESNDISTTKNLLIYFQFVNAKSCTLEVKFMKLLALKQCDATAISKEIIDYLH